MPVALFNGSDWTHKHKVINGGTGLSDTAMRQQSTFTGASRNFTVGIGVWAMSDGCSYPWLQAIPQDPPPGDAPPIITLNCSATVSIEFGGTYTELGAMASDAGDLDRDGTLSFSELLRIIQLFNLLGYHCADNFTDTEDGFIPAPGVNIGCTPHSVDYNPQNWIIELTELLRVIQIFNLGGYSYCPGSSEDGFCFE